MKYSTAVAMAMAPLALAKAVHNVYPVRGLTPRENKPSNNNAKGNSGKGVGVGGNSINLTPAEIQLLGLQGFGISTTNIAEVIVVWVNGGNNAATSIINGQQTVTTTVTVTAGAGGAAAPATTSVSTATVINGPSGTVPATGATHTVTVGGPGGLAFQPNELSAKIGDMVVFTFLSNNHTASQSAFATPCKLLEGGMDSGFQPNPNNTVNPPPQVAMQVMVDTPLWFYCKQAGHCGKGMVMAINPTAAKTQALFQSMAIAQNGTGAGTGITGGPGAAPPPPAGGAAASSVSTGLAQLPTDTVLASGSAGELSTTLAQLPTATNAAGAAAGTGVVVGSGTIDGSGACQCSVVCNFGSFPAVAQGVGNFGGVAGALPINSFTSAVAAPTKKL